MKISKNTATDLIREISSVIDYDINIMDENGIIMASTDPLRPGQFHEGAHLVIKENLRELPVYYDDEYAGCKKGINLPLFSDDNIIGVVGITGEVSETSRYAKIIKKVTEILVKDFETIQQKDKKEHARMLFISNWINDELDDPDHLADTLRKYHLDPHSPMTAALISLSDPEYSISEFLDSRIDKTHILTGYNNDFGMLIGNFDSAAKFRDYLEPRFNSEFPQEAYLCIIGTCYPDCKSAVESFRQARRAMSLKRNCSSGIYLYDDLLLDIIIASVDIDHKKRFTDMIFRNCNDNEINDVIHFINIYYKNNGSINAIARELFIHNNTVQYKISKIINRTGLDPRITKDLISLYLAGRWYHS